MTLHYYSITTTLALIVPLVWLCWPCPTDGSFLLVWKRWYVLPVLLIGWLRN